jgi:hypothetical protein
LASEGGPKNNDLENALQLIIPWSLVQIQPGPPNHSKAYADRLRYLRSFLMSMGQFWATGSKQLREIESRYGTSCCLVWDVLFSHHILKFSGFMCFTPMMSQQRATFLFSSS